MQRWRNMWRTRASWPVVLGALAALIAFSAVFLNGPDAAWTRAVAAAGGVAPETLPGLPAIEPARAIGAIIANGGVRDYVTWQAIDVPFALLNLIVLTAAPALLLRRLGTNRLVAATLWLPVIYFAAELLENTALVAFALGAVAPQGPLALLQQSATTIKLVSGNSALIVGLGSLVAVIATDTAQRLAPSRAKPDQAAMNRRRSD